MTKQMTSPDTGQVWWKSPMTWVLGLILIAGVGAVFIAASTRSTNADSLSEETGPVEISGDPLGAYVTPDTAIGAIAPSITANTFDGEQVEISSGDGTARLIGFFAHWCPHCQDEMPAVVSWLESNPLPDGVEMVAISTGVDPSATNYPPSDWFEEEGWESTVLLDSEDQTIAATFGLTAFPFWVAVDADGAVVTRVSGAIPEAAIAALVTELAPSAE